MNLHPHEQLALREGRLGLIVRPVEPQPPSDVELMSQSCDPGWHGYAQDEPNDYRPTGFSVLCPHRPGDVILIGATDVKVDCHRGMQRCHECDDTACYDNITPRITIASVECKLVRELAEEEWHAAGCDPARHAMYPRASHVAEEHWHDTYAALGPAYAWEQCWVWCYYLQGEHASPRLSGRE